MHPRFAQLPVSEQDRAKAFHTEKPGCHVVADALTGGDEPGGTVAGFRDSECTRMFVSEGLG